MSTANYAILDAVIIESPTSPTTIVSKPNIHLTDADRAMLSSECGEAARVALQIIIRMAEMMDAQELMLVSQAHADSAWYGPGSIAFGKRLRDYGGKFKVPTNINAINVDQKRWRALSVNSNFGLVCDELAQAYTELGGTTSFTCATYLLDTVPKLAETIVWGESNAVIYASSVLGARTLKNPNMFEALIALTGRAPKAGVYLDVNRLAPIWLTVSLTEELDDSFWPILGFAVGAAAIVKIPVISGLERLKPSKDDFKAFSAAFATSSSAPMFHMVSVTP